MGITLEEIEVNASLPINPTIIRIMRVLRIARGMSGFQHLCLPSHSNQLAGADGKSRLWGWLWVPKGFFTSPRHKGLSSTSGLGYGWTIPSATAQPGSPSEVMGDLEGTSS